MIAIKKDKQKISEYLFMAGLFVILLLVAGFIFFKPEKPQDSFYVFPENPKQGDTVYIKVKTLSDSVSGTFGADKLDFYRKDKSDWVALLGIDADLKPGDYNLAVNVGGTEAFLKDINVWQANFIYPKPAAVPLPKKIAQAKQKIAETIMGTDNSATGKALSQFTEKPYFTGPFDFPLSGMKVSGYPFGQFIGFGKYQLQHFGVDLRALEDTDVYAINDGKVVLADNLPDYGKIIIIDHGLDIFSLYLHLDKFDVTLGDMVKKGELIGLSGKTGYVFGPHLHFSVRIGNAKVDPVAFINLSQSMEIGNGSFFAGISEALHNFIK